MRELVNRELIALLVAGWAWNFPGLATAQVQRDRGEQLSLRLAGRLDIDLNRVSRGGGGGGGGGGAAPDYRGEQLSLRLSRELGRSSGDALALAAAPRASRGKSALIAVAPASAQPPQNNAAPVPAAALTVAQGRQPAAAPSADAAEQPAALWSRLKLWAIPPIRWGGYTAMDLRGVSAQGQPSQMQLVESVNFRASSYLWQPWFAQVSGELNLNASQQRAGEASPGVSATTGARTNFTSLSGNAQLALVPQSRFPFTAFFSETDSRTGGELVSNPFTSRRYGLTQSYSPAQGGSSYQLNYTRSDITSDAFGTDSAKVLDAITNWSSGSNTLSVNANRYTNTRSNSSDASSLASLYATHSYRPRPTFAVESQANFSANQYRLESADQPMDLRSRFLQLNSFANWQPEQNSPLTVRGGVRLYQNNASTDDASADSRIVSANASASYTLNSNTTLNGSGGVSQVTNGDSSSIFSNQAASISYSSDAIKLGEYAYNWVAGANLGNQTGGDSSGRSLGTNIGHRLSRSMTLGADSTLSMDLSQDYSMYRDTLLSSSRSLQQSVGASWSKSLGETANTGLSMNFSDTRSQGDIEQHFQFFNLRANGQMQFNRWSSLNANLSFQAMRQDASSALLTAANGAIESVSTSAGGNLIYQHGRAFGVPRLRYYGSVNLNQFQDRSRFKGDIDAPLERVTWAIEQRLDYDIGRLQTQLSLRFAEAEHGGTNGMIFFRLMRQFGN